jgi:3-oxoacyl-[acyl-carrier protein] reductase
MAIIITGASGGIGKEIARALAISKQGNLVLTYLKDKTSVERLSEGLNVSNLILQVDVTSEESVAKMVSRVFNTFGHIDVLINNAGISSNNMVWKFSVDEWNNIINTNLTGPFICMKHVIPHMRAREYGRIINITSVVGQIGIAGTAAYAASKAGLVGLTKTVAKEVANKNILVNAISLGYFDTGLINTLSDTTQKEILNSIPLGRFGNINDIGRTVSFLCNTDYITGQVINLNGGLYM